MRTITLILSLTISCLLCSQNNKGLLQKADINHTNSQLISDDDVRVFIQEVLNSDIPASHQLNQEYFSLNNYQEAVNHLSNYYPEFFGLTGQNLIDAIRQHPEKYKLLVYDTKLLREFFGGNQ